MVIDGYKGKEKKGFEKECDLLKSIDAGNAASGIPSIYASEGMNRLSLLFFDFQYWHDVVQLFRQSDYKRIGCASELHLAVAEQFNRLDFFGVEC